MSSHCSRLWVLQQSWGAQIAVLPGSRPFTKSFCHRSTAHVAQNRYRTRSNSFRSVGRALVQFDTNLIAWLYSWVIIPHVYVLVTRHTSTRTTTKPDVVLLSSWNLDWKWKRAVALITQLSLSRSILGSRHYKMNPVTMLTHHVDVTSISACLNSSARICEIFLP